jgi:hypothetical protein
MSCSGFPAPLPAGASARYVHIFAVQARKNLTAELLRRFVVH